MRLLALSLLLVASASAAQEAPADSTLGTLAGVMTDAETGEPLVGANVWLPELRRGVAADMRGQYSIDVPQGTYVVWVSFAGFERVELSGIEVDAEDVRELNATSRPVETEYAAYCWGPPLISTSAYTRRTLGRGSSTCCCQNAEEVFAFERR